MILPIIEMNSVQPEQNLGLEEGTGSDLVDGYQLNPLAAPFVPGSQAGELSTVDWEYIECDRYSPETEFEVLFQYDPEFAVQAEDAVLCSTCDMNAQFTDGGEGEFQYDIQLAKLIVDSQKYNYEGERIPLKTRWNTDILARLLQDYDDREVLQFIQFGWPIDRKTDLGTPDAMGKNHNGATQFPEAVDRHIEEEIKFGAVAGGFGSKPLPEFATSPINTRPKRSSAARRIILDLSWGKDQPSINAGLNKHQYLGRAVKLQYPTVFTLVKRIKEVGAKCLMYKKDLHKAFSQIPICPSAYRYTGFEWKGKYYFYKMMPQGLTIACLACQRTTDCITHIHNGYGYYLCNYIDDLAGAEHESVAQDAYLQLGETLAQVGLVESPEKAVEPTDEMEFLGNLLNSRKMTIGVIPSRKIELIEEMKKWGHSSHITRRQLESVIGKLQFVCNCIRSGRVFLNRLLNFLRKTKVGIRYRLPEQAKADLKWWEICLPGFSGTSMMWYEAFEFPDERAAADASGEAAGAVCGTQYIRVQFPGWLKVKCIAVKELWAIILLLKVWGPDLMRLKVILYCDNQAVADLINTGRARDVDLQEGLREICYLAAVHNLEIYSVFLPGEENRLPDLASRWWKSEKYRREFRIRAPEYTRRSVRNSLFYFSHSW